MRWLRVSVEEQWRQCRCLQSPSSRVLVTGEAQHEWSREAGREGTAGWSPKRRTSPRSHTVWLGYLTGVRRRLSRVMMAFCTVAYQLVSLRPEVSILQAWSLECTSFTAQMRAARILQIWRG